MQIYNAFYVSFFGDIKGFSKKASRIYGNKDINLQKPASYTPSALHKWSMVFAKKEFVRRTTESRISIMICNKKNSVTHGTIFPSELQFHWDQILYYLITAVIRDEVGKCSLNVVSFYILNHFGVTFHFLCLVCSGPSPGWLDTAGLFFGTRSLSQLIAVLVCIDKNRDPHSISSLYINFRPNIFHNDLYTVTWCETNIWAKQRIPATTKVLLLQ